MIQNINKLVFSRTRAENKLHCIKTMEDDIICSITESSITRILHEVGNRIPNSQNRELVISTARRKGNHWNSELSAVRIIKKKLYFVFSCQGYKNTVQIMDSYKGFLDENSYQGRFSDNKDCDDVRLNDFAFSKDEKADILRSIIVEYIIRKYYMSKVA